MTIEETADVMDLLQRFYPAFYARQPDESRWESTKLWAVMFEQDDLRLVKAAVKSFIAMDEKGFPPVPGQIKAKLRLIMARGELPETEAWNMVRKAVRNSGYESQKEFEKLPPSIQKLVGSPNQLREWALMDSDTFNSVVSSNFLKAYRIQSAREREYNALPPDVQELVGQIAATKEMAGLTAKKQEVLPRSTIDITQRPGYIKKMAQTLRQGQTPDVRVGKGDNHNGE